MNVYIVHFDAIAVLLTCINLYIFYNQKKVRDSTSSRFERVLWITLGSSIFSAVSSVAINRPDLFNVETQLVTTWFFYLFHNALPFTISLYAASITGKKTGSRRNRALFALPYFAGLIIILTNPLTRFVFYYDPALGYQNGDGLLVLYLLASSYLLYVSYLFITRYKSVPKVTRVVIPLVLVLPLIAIGVEQLFTDHQILLECFAASVSMLLVLYTIQNSSELVDGATGLFNRAAFLKSARTLFENETKFDVLLLSIRNMPLLRQVFDIQDLLHMLQAMSLFFTRQTGKTGTVYMLDNDSFALLLSGSAAESEKRTLIDSIRRRFDLPWTIGETEAAISVQLCLLHCPEEAKGVMEIFDCLERLSGTDPGEDQSEVLSPESLKLVDSKREAEAEKALHTALETGRIELLFQSIYSVVEARFVFAEAMLALQTDEGKPIPQRELLRVAERNGLAQRLGLMIIDSVCASYSARGLAAKGIEQIQIRLSGAQCIQSDLSDHVLAVIEAWNFDPRRICFQITETAAVHSPVIMTNNMKTLSEKKLNFALDDYGSGYTDLGYIVELPFNLIKLDKSIVRAGFESKKGRIILHSTIELIKRLNRKIVAEGVETADQADILATLGCDYLQGYYFSKPAPAAEFKTEWVV